MRSTTCTIRGATVVLVAALSVVLPAPASAQAARQLGGVGITVWIDANFRGQSVTFRAATPDLRQFGFNNGISSLRIARGEYWEACEQQNFGGRCQVFSGEERDLGNTSWNDKISSLRPVRGSASGGNVVTPPRPSPGNGPQVVLFSQPGFGGESRVFNGPVADIRRANFNDRAQSARVIGNWQFCQDVNFARCRQVSSDWPSLAQAGLPASLSSLRPAGGVAPPPVGRLTLYTQPNYGGASYQITGPMAQTGKIVAQSAAVTQGAWYVCDGRQFTGRCRSISGNVQNVRSIGIGAIQSARPQ
jgi:hypothetical protein